MKYRKFGNLDWEASALGFGAMRLPFLGSDFRNIDEPQAIKMIRHAIDNGVNYVDTAYPYHGGSSEVVVGKALKDGYREKVRLATKLPCWLIKGPEDFDKYFNEQLERLDTPHVDFYLIHGLRYGWWPEMKEHGVFDWAEKMKEEGKIRHLGFSFHEEYPLFEQIMEDHERFDFCQIQLNYMDTEYQAGLKGLRFAAEKGLAVVIMEPIKGGKLGVAPPQAVQEIWDKAENERKPAERALQWVWNHPEVSVVLSGMSEMWQVEENLKYADRSGPGSLTEQELALYDEVEEAYRKLGFIGCTACGYCMPCPQGVEIPKILGFHNEFHLSGRDDAVKEKYWKEITPENHSDNCAYCAQCEEKCPQHLPIRKFLRETTFMFRREE
jgi:predicted aldo/keto reductase-like oxidoreductase